MSGINLQVDPAALEPLIRQVVTETVRQLQAEQERLDNRLAFSEEEAARLLGLNPHQLRDERRRGRVQASEIVGRRVRYLRQDLVDYLARQRLNGAKR